MTDKIKGVLFDVGGVLHVPDHEVMRRFLGPLAGRLSAGVIDRAHYVAMALAERWDGEAGGAPFDDYLTKYLFALGVPHTDLDEVSARYMQELGGGIAWTQVVDGAAKLLRELEADGLKLGIVSNTMAGGVADRLRASRICQVGKGDGARVEAVIDSHEVGVRKPDPAIFHAALRALQVDASEVVFVGDALGADVGGAEAVGMTPVHFDPLGLCPRDDHHHVTSLPGVASVVRSLPDAGLPERGVGPGVGTLSIERLLGVLAAWSIGRDDIRALGLVGSHAREAAKADSDVDLVLLTTRCSDYLEDDSWIESLPGFGPLGTRRWGAITERRLRGVDGLELDVGIGEPAWASTSPVDEGTRNVAEGGLRILQDPDGLLKALVLACRPVA